MSKSRLRGRAGLTCVVALVCASAVACDSVLDIQDPMIRPPEGEGGEPNTGGTAGNTAGSTATPEGGGAGVGVTNGGAGGTDAITAGAGSGGEGGQGDITPRDCETDSTRCTGSTPEVCDEFGHWVQNEAEAAGECAVQCSEGRCVECVPDEKNRCAVCDDGDASCNTNQPQSCVDGAWKSAGAACTGYCDNGLCIVASSCPTFSKPTTTCRSGESCCASIQVPGGTFKRDYDGTDDYGDDSFPAGIRPHFLDKYEVTVGRMRQFVDVIENLSLNSGQGKALHVDGDLGWTNSLNDSLPKNKAALVTQLKCDSSATWSDDPAQNNELPVNCVTFPVAYAFCIWDGGRLPTEAEWNFAAAGGSEQRIYPWQLPAVEDLPTPENASWFNADSGPQPAGSKPKGDARWGHADLASNVQEWVLDYVNGDYVLPCTDCMNATVSDARGVRGGAWTLRSEALVASSRSSLEEGVARSIIGFRCARDSE